MIRAAPAHAKAMAAVHQAVFTGLDCWTATFFAEQLGMPGRFGFLHPAGGMALARIVAEEAEILTLAVAPEARRRGIGRALMRETAAEAARNGARVLFLEVAEDNLAARALYDRFGFSPVGMRRNYYADGGHAVVMRAVLRVC